MKSDSHGVLKLTRVLLGVLTLSGGVVFAASQHKKGPAAAVVVYRLESVRGDVLLYRGKKNRKPQKVSTEQNLQAGDRIVTGSNSSAAIVHPKTRARTEMGSVTIVSLESRGTVNLGFGALLAKDWPQIRAGKTHELVPSTQTSRYFVLSARDDAEASQRLSGLLPTPPALLESLQSPAVQILVMSGRLSIREHAKQNQQPAITLSSGELLKISDKTADFIPTKIGESEANEALRQLGFASAESGTLDAVSRE